MKSAVSSGEVARKARQADPGRRASVRRPARQAQPIPPGRSKKNGTQPAPADAEAKTKAPFQGAQCRCAPVEHAASLHPLVLLEARASENDAAVACAAAPFPPWNCHVAMRATQGTHCVSLRTIARADSSLITTDRPRAVLTVRLGRFDRVRCCDCCPSRPDCEGSRSRQGPP